jgi:hypothetical protein
MQLATYIQDLLYRYECVIIPGFGAFLTHYKSAQIDSDSNTLYPPGKSISFNRQLQTNDGLLANYIASVDGSTYETALAKLRSYTGNLSLQLSEGKTVSVEKIGEFKINEEQSVQFIPSEIGNFNPASFGLTPFVSIAIQREVYKSEVAALEAETPLLFTPEKREKYPYLKYAAVALIAVSVSGLVGFNIYKNNVAEFNFAEKQKANTLLDTQIQEATFVIENPLPALNVTVSKQIGKYHIVAGAFRVENNAYKKIAQLNDKGFSPRYIGKNKYGLHEVVYNSFEDRLEALRSLRTIKNTENKDAWLLVKKLD